MASDYHYHHLEMVGEDISALMGNEYKTHDEGVVLPGDLCDVDMDAVDEMEDYIYHLEGVARTISEMDVVECDDFITITGPKGMEVY